MSAVLERREDGELVRRAGVMAIVVVGGSVQAGDDILMQLPGEPHLPLECV